MGNTSSSPAALLRRAWRRLSPLPGGRWLFSKAAGFFIPYTGSARPRVEELRPGYARVLLFDCRAVRNHLSSVHAIALMNVAEFSTGLAMTFGAPDDSRAILTSLSIEYTKKARGTITAQASCEPPATSERREVPVQSVLTDAAGDVVARAVARWLVGPAGPREPLRRGVA